MESLTKYKYSKTGFLSNAPSGMSVRRLLNRVRVVRAGLEETFGSAFSLLFDRYLHREQQESQSSLILLIHEA